MSYAQLDAVVSKAEDIFDHFGVSGTIVFHGSEPLLMKKTLWEVVERHKDTNFGIQTNGILFDEDDAALVKERRISVGISLDAPSEEVNDYLRGKGSSER